jgi:hypothetical protein
MILRLNSNCFTIFPSDSRRSLISQKVNESASSFIIALKSMGLDRDTAQYLVLPAPDTTAHTGSIKFSSIIYYLSDTKVTIIGDAPGPVSIACQTGWNLIGSSKEAIDIPSITGDHGAVIYVDVLHYDPASGSYHITPTLIPGEAVWIYVSGAGT